MEERVEFDKILQFFLDLKSEIKNGPGKSSRLKDNFYLTKYVGKHSHNNNYCFGVFYERVSMPFHD